MKDVRSYFKCLDMNIALLSLNCICNALQNYWHLVQMTQKINRPSSSYMQYTFHTLILLSNLCRLAFFPISLIIMKVMAAMSAAAKIF